MRIRELLENKFFKSEEFVTKTATGNELNYDLAEDLIHFLNHDDDVYRRHLYPGIAKCMDIVERKKKPAASIFKSAVEEGYKKYIKEYPIRELPDYIDEEMCEDVCKKIREAVCKDIAEGKYE
jgi:hypothetical protein